MNAPIQFRNAVEADLPDLVAMLADDPLGSQREDPGPPLPDAYLRAFAAISRDPNNQIVLATIAEEIVGLLQLTFIPGITHRGGERAHIEGVRVASGHRGAGVGQALLEWALTEARRRGCRMAQLTTDKSRPDALRFYERLGFEATHVGMKLPLR